MTRGMPSMVALLGLLAVAGYQNRDKIADLLGKMGQNAGKIRGDSSQGSVLDGLGEMLGGAGGGSVLSGGLGSLIDHFRQNGQGEAAESWVKRGANQSLTPGQLEGAIGPDVLGTLAQRTGLSKEEILSRLVKVLPDAVDNYTPEGRIPTPEEASRPA